MYQRGRLITLVMLVVVGPALLLASLSIRIVARQDAEHLQRLVDVAACEASDHLRQWFTRLECELLRFSWNIETDSAHSPQVGAYLANVQKEFHLRDVLLISSSGMIMHTSNSPEALGQAIQGTLYSNTRLPETWSNALMSGRSMTNFDPSVATATGWLVVRAIGQPASALGAEYNAQSLQAALVETPTIRKLSEEDALALQIQLSSPGGETYLHLAPIAQDTADWAIVESSATCTLDGLDMVLTVRTDTSSSQTFLNSKRLVIIATTILIFAACILSWAMFRSLGMVSAQTVAVSPRAKGAQAIAMAAAALDSEQHQQLMTLIRELVRNSVRRGNSEDDDPHPTQ